MHDPCTVCFDIKRPWREKPTKFWPQGYRPTWITVWHVDPLKFAGKHGVRDDDSCGWFTPPMSTEQVDRIRKLAKEQYSQIFERVVRTREGASYAYICFDPTSYDAVYWLWRAVKQALHPRGRWQYGDGSGFLSRRELEAIYHLSSNPLDNVRSVVEEARRNEDEFERLCFIVAKQYLRRLRPWWRHPRWHIHHWRIQVRPWQQLKRRLFDRCEACGKPFGWDESPTGTWGGDKLWHSACFPKPAARPVCDEPKPTVTEVGHG